MIQYAFNYVDTVIFHIGSENIRSQKAIEKIGAAKIEEKEVQYFGETPTLNFVYAVNKANWNSLPTL